MSSLGDGDNPADVAMTWLSFCGGAILGICLLPQVWKCLVYKSTKDLSLLWQMLYSIGLTLLWSYAVYFGLWNLYIPASVEVACIYSLLFMKIRNEGLSWEGIMKDFQKSFEVRKSVAKVPELMAVNSTDSLCSVPRPENIRRTGCFNLL